MPNKETDPTSSSNSTASGSDRAQPGDVLGLDQDGKRTHLGDDAEDEDEELEDAEDEISEERTDE